MDPIILKVYDSDVDRIGEIVQQRGHLTITQRKFKTRSLEVIFYNAVYVPVATGKTLQIPYIQENITTYDNLLECISDFDKKGYYLKPEDMQKFKPIANLQFKQLLEKIVYPSEDQEEEEKNKDNDRLCIRCNKEIGILNLPSGKKTCAKCYQEYFEHYNNKEEEEEEENKIFCIKCGKDPGVGFFRLTDGNYCVECYREKFQCKVTEALQIEKEEENSNIAIGSCYKCNKTFPVNKMHLNPLADGWQCHCCYYGLDEEKKEHEEKL